MVTLHQNAYHIIRNMDFLTFFLLFHIFSHTLF